MELRATYNNIVNFLERYGKDVPEPDEARSLSMISDFFLCIGAEPVFKIEIKEQPTQPKE